MAGTAGRLRLGPECGTVLVRTRREGLASKLGHDLTIEATRWSAAITTAGEDLAQSQIKATVELDSLAVNGGAGGALALTERDRAEINHNIVKVLGRSTATFRATAVNPDHGTIDGTLSLNGVSRPARLLVNTADGVHLRASMTVAQSAYQIKPYTAFLGAIRLRDEVEIDIEVDLSRARPEP